MAESQFNNKENTISIGNSIQKNPYTFCSFSEIEISFINQTSFALKKRSNGTFSALKLTGI